MLYYVAYYELFCLLSWSFVQGNVYTSVAEMEKLFTQEKTLIENLKQYSKHLQEQLKHVNR